MLKILGSYQERKYKHYNFCLYVGISMLLAICAALLQGVVKSAFITAFVMLACCLNSNKENEAYSKLNKFDTYRLMSERLFKLNLFLYFKRNKFVWVFIFYSIFCLINLQLLHENSSLIILSLFILFCNFTGNKWSEIIAELHFIVLIICITFNLGNYINVSLNGLFCSALVILLLSEKKETKKSKAKKRTKSVIGFSKRTPIFLRYFLLGKWQINIGLIALFLIPKLIGLLNITSLYSWESTFSFTGTFSLLIIFELIQDVNLENHNVEYNKLRLQKVSDVNFFRRMSISSYVSIGLVAMSMSVLTNLTDPTSMMIQVVLIVMLVFWYKFFEEKSLIEKNKPTWQLGYIRCWIPSTIIFLTSFAPQLIQMAEMVKR